MSQTKDKQFVLKIGSKGEIFPPKEIRKELGLEKNQPIVVTVHKNSLIIRKLHDLEALLKKPPKVTISRHAWKKFRSKLSKDAES